jgi:hypothetical protein
MLVDVRVRSGNPRISRQAFLAWRPGQDEERRLISVDSSAWIDYFNGVPTPEAAKLDLMLAGSPRLSR